MTLALECVALLMNCDQCILHSLVWYFIIVTANPGVQKCGRALATRDQKHKCFSAFYTYAYECFVAKFM